MTRTIVLLLFMSCVAVGNTAPVDSVGYIARQGRIFVLHKVEERETLYSISRQYAVQIPEILENNFAAKSGLEVGDTLRIPYARKAVTRNGIKIHTVEEGQTLYFISRLYDVEVEEIRKWNSLSSNELNIGQELNIHPSEAVPKVDYITPPPPEYRSENQSKQFHVVDDQETLYSISRQYGTTVEDLREWNDLKQDNIHIGQQLVVGNLEGGVETNQGIATQRKEEKTKKQVKPKEEIVYLNADHSRKYNPIKSDETGFRTKLESGLAEVIDNTADTRKYLALHRDLPVGTILMVRNEMNNKVVFVRVLGRLPDTGDHENLVIKISQAAYDRLGGVGKRFRVELTYIPLEDQNG